MFHTESRHQVYIGSEFMIKPHIPGTYSFTSLKVLSQFGLYLFFIELGSIIKFNPPTYSLLANVPT